MKKLITAGAFLLAICAGSAVQHPIPRAFGPHVNLRPKDFSGSSSFKSNDKIVGTYFFYWYDAETKFHVIDDDGSDGLTTHPPTLKDFSYKSVTWHKKQLSDMIDAKIDVALMVFWGSPADQDPKSDLHWSYVGLKPLVEARDQLVREGKTPPKIGLFYDTSTLQCGWWNEHIDLTTDYGKQWFYATVRDFYSCIPPRHWAMIDNKPIVLMYAAAFAKDWDQGFIDFTKAQFAREFGGRVPYMAPQDSWTGVKGDNVCAWGGAVNYKRAGICELGPGYDDAAVPGRQRLLREREDGKFYEKSWLRFLRRPSNFVMIETWNEFHEGTDICESREYGRQYIDLTRKYVSLFKRGWKPSWPKGEYTEADAVSVVLGSTNRENGVRQIDNEDGVTTPAFLGSKETRAVKTNPGQPKFMYFAVDDTFKWAERMNCKVRVEYFDGGAGELKLEFDGSDLAAPIEGAYTSAPEAVVLAGTKKWNIAEFTLKRARLLNSQNRDSDFRLVLTSPDTYVHRVTVER